MNKKTKIFIVLAVVAVLVAGGTYYYVMHGGARDLTTEKTEYVVGTAQIVDEFAKNPDASNAKYLEKAIVVKGKVTRVEALEVILDDVVSCELEKADPSIKKGDMITMKGRVVGFDDLMGELKLDQCFKE